MSQAMWGNPAFLGVRQRCLQKKRMGSLCCEGRCVNELAKCGACSSSTACKQHPDVPLRSCPTNRCALVHMCECTPALQTQVLPGKITRAVFAPQVSGPSSLLPSTRGAQLSGAPDHAPDQ